MDTILPSEPATYKQIIKRSFILYRASFSKVILLGLLMAVVVFVPRLLSDFIGQDIFADLGPIHRGQLWLIVVDLVALIFFVGIVWRMHCVLRNKHEPLAEDIYMGLKKVFYIFIAALLQCAIVFAVAAILYGFQILLYKYDLLFNKELTSLLLTIFVFAGQLFVLIYISTLFIFLIPLIATEKKGIMRAMESSVLLVWNHWWRVFSVQLTPWVVYIGILFVLRYILHIDLHIYLTAHNPHSIFTTLGNLVLFALFIPWVAACLLVQLRDLEFRKQSSIK